MSATPAIRLVTDALQATEQGINASNQNRQLVIDGAASIKLRKTIGNDCYSVLEVLFILAEVSPSGVVVHSANEQLREILGFGHDKVKRTLRELQSQGYIERTQEAQKDATTNRTIFGRGVLRLKVTAVDIVDEQDLTPTEGQPEGWGLWGRPLDREVCRQVLESWGVKAATRLIDSNPVVASDAVKLVHDMVRTGRPIDNPGAYARKVITTKKVSAPDPSVPPTYLTEELTIEDMIASLPEQRGFSVQRSRARQESRRKQLSNLYDNELSEEERSEIDLLIVDEMRAFSLEPEEVQEVHWFNLLENHLAERGRLASLPYRPESREGEVSAPPPAQPSNPDEPPF